MVPLTNAIPETIPGFVLRALRSGFLPLCLLIVFAPLPVFAQSRQGVAADEVIAIAQGVTDHYIATGEPFLYYDRLFTFYGIVKLAEFLGDPDYEAYADYWLETFVEEGTDRHISFQNYLMGGLPGAYRYIQGRPLTDDDTFHLYVQELLYDHPKDELGVVQHPTQLGGRIWVDCLMAVCPFLSMAAETLEDPSLHTASIDQYLGMEAQLFDPQAGLFHQSKNFGDPGCVTPDHWGRGNGWALIGLVEILQYLPEDHPQYFDMVQRLASFAEVLAPLQAESGMWRQNLTTPSSYEETSGSGMIVYAMAIGLREGWIDRSYESMVLRGWQGLTQQVDPAGSIKSTCVGTLGRCGDGLDYYLNRPTQVDDPHSFGPILLAATEVARFLVEGYADDPGGNDFPVSAAPSGLTATPVSDTGIDLSWNDNSDNETGFIVEFRSGSDDFRRIYPFFAAGVTEVRIDGLEPSTTYTFRVRGSNAVGAGDPSGESTATTMPAPYNLAEGKPVRVDSVYTEGYAGDKLTDGDSASRASSWLSKAEALPQSVEIDLQGYYDVYGIQLHKWEAFEVTGYTLEGFDGFDWVLLADVQDETAETLHEFGGSRLSKVRVTIEDTRNEDGIVRLYEVEVTGLEPSQSTSTRSLWAHVRPRFPSGSKQTGLGPIHDAFYPYVYHYPSDGWFHILHPFSHRGSLYLYDYSSGDFIWTAETYGGWHYNLTNPAYGAGGWADWTPQSNPVL